MFVLKGRASIFSPIWLRLWKKKGKKSKKREKKEKNRLWSKKKSTLDKKNRFQNLDFFFKVDLFFFPFFQSRFFSWVAYRPTAPTGLCIRFLKSAFFLFFSFFFFFQSRFVFFFLFFQSRFFCLFFLFFDFFLFFLSKSIFFFFFLIFFPFFCFERSREHLLAYLVNPKVCTIHFKLKKIKLNPNTKNESELNVYIYFFFAWLLFQIVFLLFVIRRMFLAPKWFSLAWRSQRFFHSSY